MAAQRPLHHPLSPQMMWSLAPPQKALPFLKSASPCRALLPSKPRKVKALASHGLGVARALVARHHPRCHAHQCGRLGRASASFITREHPPPVALCPRCWCVCHPCGQSSFRGLFFGKEEARASYGGPSWGPECPLPSSPAPPASPSSPAFPCQAPACQTTRLSLPPGRLERAGRFRASGGRSQSPRGARAVRAQEKQAQKLQEGR